MFSDSKSIKKLRNMYFSPKIYWWEWASVAVVVLLLLASVNYMDTVSLTIWSTNLWDVIADDKLSNFYLYTAHNYHNITHNYMSCDLFAIIPLSIWNLPIWLIQRFTDKDIAQSPGLLLWSKLGLELCCGVISFLAYKLAMVVTKDKARSLWAAMITAGSGVAAIGVGVAGQNDVFFIIYGALSVYFMMTNKKKLSLVMAACSIAVKPFFLFAYLPLILLVQKNILIAAADCLGAMSLMIFNKLQGNVFVYYKESMEAGPSKEVLVNLFNVGVEVHYGKASLFCIGVLFFCFISYMTKPASKDEENRFLIYIASGVFMVMSVFANTEFYRSITIMPFFAVLIVSDFSRLRLNLLLGYLFQLGVVFSRAAGTKKTVSAYYVGGSLFSTIFPQSDYANDPKACLRTILAEAVPDGMMRKLLLSVAGAFMVAAGLIILTICHPRFRKKLAAEEKIVLDKYDHGLLMLNSLLYLPFLITMYWIYFREPPA